jgi:uncharacterized protein (TIGR03083 family)
LDRLGYLGQTEEMTTADGDLSGEVRRFRLEFADEMSRASPGQWDVPSWCEGWRVRDVLGHLVHTAEATLPSMFWQIIRNGVQPDRAIQRIARKLGDQPVPELVERLRAAPGTFHVPGMPSEIGLGDLIVHTADAFRPIGLVPDTPLADVLVVLHAYTKWGRRVVHAVPHRSVSLVASDADWRYGSGPEVTGKAIDLLLLMANRRQVMPSLSGPGLKLLAL